MGEKKRFAFLWNPTFRLIATWVWWAVGAGITLWMIANASGIDFKDFRTIYSQSPHLLIYVEIVGVGLFPLLLTIICRDDLTLYGIRRDRLFASLFWSALVVVANSIYLFLATGNWLNWRALTVHLDFPLNLWYAALGFFVYGPLEVFFVIWLIVNAEQAIRGQFLTVSWGLIVTVMLVGLAHIATSSNLTSAIYVTVIFFLFGLISGRTKNSLGPMIAWTLINGQVWFLVQFLWS